MKYVNGDVYFKKKKKDVYPYLNEDIMTDICIIGGGFSGLLNAYFLSETKKDITLVEKNIVGYGLSLGIKGNVMIDYDMILEKKKIGEINALLKLYNTSKDTLKQILNETKTKYYEIDKYVYVNKMMQKGSVEKYINLLNDMCNLDINILDKVDGINAIILAKFDEKVISFNSSEFLNNLAEYLVNERNVKIYENTEAEVVNPSFENVTIETNNNFKIYASKVIYANGMSAQSVLNFNLNIYQKFNILLEKNEELIGKEKYLENFNMHDTQIKITKEMNIEVCGEDTKITMKMLDDKYRKNLEKDKYSKLVVIANKIIDAEKYMNRGRCYSNIYAKTFDMLPIIDEIECMPNCFVSASFGYNSILNGIISGNILKNAVDGLYTKEVRFFRINREGCIGK